MTETTLDIKSTLRVLQQLQGQAQPEVALRPEEHALVGVGQAGTPLFALQLPLVFPPIQERPAGVSGGVYSPLARVATLDEYTTTCEQALTSSTPLEVVLILMEAGQCALGRFRGEEPGPHKVIRKYMVRKKQGKAQLNYLHQKGKSRAGSRIRLQQSAAFFEEINEWLATTGQVTKADVIVYSCPTRLWSYLFHAKRPCPFDADDSRLRPLKRYVDKPDHQSMRWAHRQAIQGTLTQHHPESLPFSL